MITYEVTTKDDLVICEVKTERHAKAICLMQSKKGYKYREKMSKYKRKKLSTP